MIDDREFFEISSNFQANCMNLRCDCIPTNKNDCYYVFIGRHQSHFPTFKDNVKDNIKQA